MYKPVYKIVAVMDARPGKVCAPMLANPAKFPSTPNPNAAMLSIKLCPRLRETSLNSLTCNFL